MATLQAHTGKQTWGQKAIFVIQNGAYAKGAAAALHPVVEKVDLAGMEEALLIGEPDLNRDLGAVATEVSAGALGVTQEGILIDVEIGIHLVLRHQCGQHARSTVCRDQVALGHQCTPCPADDRRAYLGPFQIELCRIDRRLGRHHIGLGRFIGSVALLPQLGRDGVLGDQHLGAARFVAALRRHAGRTSKLCIGTRQLGAVIAGVDSEQHIALFHLLTFPIVHALEIPRYTGTQFDTLNRFNAATVFIPLGYRIDHNLRRAHLGRRHRYWDGLVVATGKQQGTQGQHYQQRRCVIPQNMYVFHIDDSNCGIGKKRDVRWSNRRQNGSLVTN
ncbi:hypothetical protein D3C80_1060940 [compost metagenome]